MCVLAGTATGVCLEKGPRMSDISGESTGTDYPFTNPLSEIFRRLGW